MIKNLTNQTDLSGLYFIYNGSTNLERKGIYGMAHLMEHLKCKSFDDLQDELQSSGISWNAYTSNSKVVFYFTGLEEYLAPFRDILIERMYMPFDSYITEADLDKEKQIVLEEYQDSFTNQNEIFFLNFMRKKFDYYSPIGLKEDIENLTYQDCLDFYKLQYTNPDDIINISKSYVMEKELAFEDRTDRIDISLKENLDAPLELRGDYPDTLCLTYYREVEDSDIPHLKIINNMLSSGLNSPLYQEIREKRALCYSVGSYLYKIANKNFIFVEILTSPNKLDIAHETLGDIFKNKEIHISQNRLNTIKKSFTISNKKKHINRHQNIDDILDENVQILNDMIDSVSLESIHSIYDKYFYLDSFTQVTDKNY